MLQRLASVAAPGKRCSSADFVEPIDLMACDAVARQRCQATLDVSLGRILGDAVGNAIEAPMGCHAEGPEVLKEDALALGGRGRPPSPHRTPGPPSLQQQDRSRRGLQGCREEMPASSASRPEPGFARTPPGDPLTAILSVEVASLASSVARDLSDCVGYDAREEVPPDVHGRVPSFCGVEASPSALPDGHGHDRRPLASEAVQGTPPRGSSLERSRPVRAGAGEGLGGIQVGCNL